MATDKELSNIRGPFRVYPKKKKEEPISTMDEYKKEFIKSLEAYDVRQKKPVRWNFLKDNEGMFQLSRELDPMMKLNEGLYKVLTKKPFWTETVSKTFRERTKERDYIEGFDEIAKGIETGKHELSTSLGELLFMGTDFLVNTNFTRDFQKMMEEQQPDTPETWRGELAELMVQYGAPASAVLKIANRAKKLQVVKNAVEKMGTSKASKIAQRVVEGATVLGATDFIASPDKRRMPTLLVQPEDTSKLSGRKKAAAMFRNKVRYGAEGALVGGLFPLAGKAAQQAYKYAGRPVGEPALRMGFNTIGTGFKGASWLLARNPVLHSDIARSLVGSTRYNVKKMLSPWLSKLGYKGLPPFKDWRLFQVTSPNKTEARLKRVDNVLSWFRSFGKTPQTIEGISEAVILNIKSKARKIDKLLEGMEKRAYGLAKKFGQRKDTNMTSKAYEKMLLDDAVDYLQGKKKLSGLDPDLRPLAYALRKDINKILTEFGKNLPKGTKNDVIDDLRKALTGKVDGYLVRSFSIFNNPKYVPDKNVRIDAKNWLLDNVVRKNKDMREAALTAHGSQFPRNYLERYADDLVNDILETGRASGVNPVKVMKEIGKLHLRGDKYQFMKTGEELPKTIKRLLGQEKDLRSQVLFTVSDAIAATATKKGFDRIAAMGLKNGWLFDSLEAARTRFRTPAQITGIKRLGSMKSTIEGLWTHPELVQMFRGSGTALDRIIKMPVWRQLLQFKVGVQAGKTLYSPQTQVRNVTSASFFSLWNGHVGHNSSVINAMRMVLKDVFKAGKGQPINEVEFAEYVEKMVRLGVWDENIVAQEMRAVMNNLKEGVIRTEDELFEKIMKTLPTEKAARLYAGGDNLWKQYGFEFYKSDFSTALKSINDVEKYLQRHGKTFSRKHLLTGETKSLDAALDEVAAFALRNTYPTYSKVPPAIQELRKIPLFGNFVSFPAEMLRTGGTAIAMSLRDLATDNPVLRQMAYKRLLGGYLALKGIGEGAHAIANFITGNSKEQWDAYKRSGAAPWDKNSNLIGITPWEDGESAAINFSYFSPYDVLERPVQAALTMAAKQDIVNEQIDDYVLSLMFDEDGPFMELLQPFLSPAIGLERVQDIVSGNFLIGGRTGETAEGFRIYSPTDTLEDKINKSFVHIVKGANPGIISSGMKIKSAIRGDVSGAGKPMELGDELMALFTGTRIIRIDVKKDLRWRTSDANRLLRAVDETEKFYKAKGFIDRPPSVMVDAFENMQQEAFRVQRDLYMIVKDLQMLDLSKDKIEEIMVKAGMNKKMVSSLIDGEFTPIKYSKPRFETKVDTLKDLAKHKTEKSKDFIYNIRESFVFPEDKLDNIMDKWEDKKFFPEGYKPEEKGAVTNDKGRVVYDEKGKIKREPTILQRGFERIKPLISPFSGQRSQTPLPATPNVNPRLITQTPQNISPRTGLTQTETALLSPQEQAMRLRQRGMA